MNQQQQALADLLVWEDDDTEECGTDPASLVYFFLRTDGLIKIGWSANLAQRERTLKTAAGPLVLLATIRGSHVKEKRLHDIFNADRVWPRQEWFRPTRPLLDFIDQAVNRQMAETMGSLH